MTVKVGVIGTGGIGQGHIERIMTKVPGATVSAVNDINTEVCKQVAEKWGATFMADPHALINSPEVDAILIASWDPTHEEYCVAAIQAGKPVLCEKPLADTSAGCKHIMEVEMAGGKHLLTVGFMRRYDQGYVELRQAIASGRLGKPLILHCVHRNQYPLGAKHTTDMTVTGALVHEFDICRFLIGEDDLYTSAQLAYGRSSKYADEDLIDPQLVYLETKNGVRINLEFFANSHYAYEVGCQVVGEEGCADLPRPAHITVREKGQVGSMIEPFWMDRFPAAYEAELCAWIEDVQKGEVNGPTAWDGFITAFVAEKCIQSRQEKKIVDIDLGETPAFYKR